MQDRDDNRQTSGRNYGQGWRDDDRGQGRSAQRNEDRSFGEPPYGDQGSYGRQGQRGGQANASQWNGPGAQPDRYVGDSGGAYDADYGHDGPDQRGRGGGSYGQRDQSGSAQRSTARQDAQPDNLYGGGRGGYSGYGSSGQGQYGSSGYPQGGRGQGDSKGGYGQYRSGEAGYGQGDLSAGRGREGVYGEGAGRFGQPQGPGQGASRPIQAYGGGDRSDTYAADFDPHYLDWRKNQEASYDRDYNHWRERQLKSHDEEYRAWRDQRRSKFHEDFNSWRSSRSGDPITGAQSTPSTTGTSTTLGSSGGEAASGFATHQVSGATNADLSGGGDSGPAAGLGGAAATNGSAGSGRSSGVHASGVTGTSPAAETGSGHGPADQANPLIKDIADGGDGHSDKSRTEGSDDR